MRATAICCTFARTDHLVEALACFLAQDHPDKQMIIFNTCVHQRLMFQHPEVVVVNHLERPKTMGETRNLAIDWAAEGSLLVTWDDDDLYLPNHLSNFLIGFDPVKHHYSKQDKQLYMESLAMKGVCHGTANVFAFTKHAWRSVGGYSAINVGEDQQFVGKITSQFGGVFVPMTDGDASFVYRWGTGTHHLSGQGQDKPGLETSMQRQEKWANDQLNAMREPRGDIVLQPMLKQDYGLMASKFTKSVNRQEIKRRGNIGIVCLGHAGDILNILPVAKHIADNWRKPKFFTSRTYGEVLEGVSYVEPILLDLPDKSILQAVEAAKQMCEYVLPIQCHGDGWQFDRFCDSYNMEAWRMGGFLADFFDVNRFPLDIDRRDGPRETTLYRQHVQRENKPLMLVNLTGGLSSPWVHGRQLLEYLTATWKGTYQVLDLAKIKAHRLYDMLGLLEQAAILISSDTYTLHLAVATTVPVVAILNDNSQPFGKPWLRTSPRCNAVMQLGYSTAIQHTADIDKVIKQEAPKLRQRRFSIPSKPVTTRIFHCVEIHGAPDPRRERAQKSWKRLYDQRGVIPVHYSEYQRTARDVLGDPRDLPFLKDVLQAAMDKAGDRDIILWTNDDVWLHYEIMDVLQLHIGIWEACTSHRLDYNGAIPGEIITPEEFVRKCPGRHCGRDLFAATAGWLKAHWDQIPDAVLGAPMFDLHLAAVVRHAKGYPVSRRNIEDIVPHCELPKGYVIHELHEPAWGRLPGHTPSHLHNAQQFENWARKHQPSLRFFNGQI